MTTLKQILCAILNFGHPYESQKSYIIEDRPELTVYRVFKKECSCGKVWERKR